MFAVHDGDKWCSTQYAHCSSDRDDSTARNVHTYMYMGGTHICMQLWTGTVTRSMSTKFANLTFTLMITRELVPMKGAHACIWATAVHLQCKSTTTLHVKFCKTTWVVLGC